MGIRYLSDGNYEEAIIAFTAAIEIDAKKPEVFLARGNAYIETANGLSSGGDAAWLELAVKDYLTAIDLGDAQSSTYFTLSDVYMRLGNIEEAMEILWEGYEITEDETLSKKAIALYGYSLDMVSRVDLYATDGRLVQTTEAQYDDFRRLTKKECYTYDTGDSGIPFWYSLETWEYDDTNLTTTHMYDYEGEEPAFETIDGVYGEYANSVVGSYGDQYGGPVIVSEPFLGTEDGVVYNDYDPLPWDHAVYQYDSNGLVTSIATYNSNGELTGRAELEYLG